MLDPDVKVSQNEKDQRMDKEIKRGEVVHGSIMGQADGEKKIN